MGQAKNEGQRFTLSGEVKGRDTGILILAYNKVKDTAILNAGKFSFSGYLEAPTLANLSGDVKSRSMDDPNYTTIFLESQNMRAVLTENDFNHAQINGSYTQYEWDLYNKQKESISNELKNFKKEINILKSEGRSAALQNKLDSFQSKLALCILKLHAIKYKFVASNPQSFLSPYLMCLYRNDNVSADSAKYFYQRFSPGVKNSYWGKYIYEAIQNDERTSLGNVAPGFVRKDINGKSISLDSVRRKGLVLLDFWASWCVPCRKMSPHLEELYRKYHGKGFEIISISVDTDTSLWKNAITKEGIQIWFNILNTDNRKKSSSDTALNTKYSVSIYPTIILIGKDGTIIGRYIGFSEDDSEYDLDQKLKEIFQ